MSSFECITAENIPDDYYVCHPTEWEYICRYEFENGLVYYYGSNSNDSEQSEDIMKEMIQTEYGFFDEIDTPYDLQEYYYENFGIFTRFSDIEKIWSYYTNNENLIKEIINSNEELSDNESVSSIGSSILGD